MVSGEVHVSIFSHFEEDQSEKVLEAPDVPHDLIFEDIISPARFQNKLYHLLVLVFLLKAKAGRLVCFLELIQQGIGQLLEVKVESLGRSQIRYCS